MADVYKEQLAAKETQAAEIIADRAKLQAFLEQIDEKLFFVPMKGNTLIFIPYFISLLWEYVRQAYVEQNTDALITMVKALLCVEQPFEALTNEATEADVAEEIALYKETLLQVKAEIDCYKIWSAVRGVIVPKIPEWEEVL